MSIFLVVLTAALIAAILITGGIYLEVVLATTGKDYESRYR